MRLLGNVGRVGSEPGLVERPGDSGRLNADEAPDPFSARFRPGMSSGLVDSVVVEYSNAKFCSRAIFVGDSGRSPGFSKVVGGAKESAAPSKVVRGVRLDCSSLAGV